MLYAISIIALALLFLINLWAIRKGFYKKERKIFWFGRVMHFSGGFFVAMFFSNLIQNYLVIVGLTLLVAMIWEIGEFFFGHYKFKKYGTKEFMTEPYDTFEDVVLGIVGAVIWLWWI